MRSFPQSGCCGGTSIPAEFVLINQDGSGRTVIARQARERSEWIAFLTNGGNSDSYLAQQFFGLYLFRPSQAEGIHICQDCGNYSSYDDGGGLLATFYQESEEVSPELIIIELPGGKIIERFPLVRCPEDADFCEEQRSDWPEMMRQAPQWSPDGRYLAFVAVLDTTSSEIFIYDTQVGNLRRLTDDPNWVGGIEWSPDGSQIIMQALLTDEELLSHGEYFYAPGWSHPAYVWSVSFSTSKTSFLYSIDSRRYTPQGILFWLDDNRFIAYEGIPWDAMDSAINLHFADTESGTNRILFDDQFFDISYDPIHGTFALYQVGSGTYLVSMSDGNIIYLDGYQSLPIFSFPSWDENTGLFVTEDPCEDDPQQVIAVDYQGNFQCIPKPSPMETATYPAPDGEKSVFVNNGLWLETGDEPAVLVSQETAGEVIWCPNSSCFFFTVAQQEDWLWTLYHVSMPNLTIEMVDENIESAGDYQWLGGE